MLKNDKSEIIHYAVQYKNGIVRLYIIHMILWDYTVYIAHVFLWDYTLYIWYCEIIHGKYKLKYVWYCEIIVIQNTLKICYCEIIHYTRIYDIVRLYNYTGHMILWDYTLYILGYCEICL